MGYVEVWRLAYRELEEEMKRPPSDPEVYDLFLLMMNSFADSDSE